MKDLFLIDFDGTITKRDFYLTFIDKYSLHALDKDLLAQVNEGLLSSYTYLDKILSAVEVSKSEIDELVDAIEPDDYFFEFLATVDSDKYEVAIVSAGNSYYIKEFLLKSNLEYISVYANEGTLDSGRLVMKSDINFKYYSDYYGIDKRKVLLSLKDRYNRICYIGDGRPDYEPAIVSNIVFAKRRLAQLLSENGYAYNHFDNFSDIINTLELNSTVSSGVSFL